MLLCKLTKRCVDESDRFRGLISATTTTYLSEQVQMTDTVLSNISEGEVRQGLARQQDQQDQQDPMEGFRSIFISDALSVGALKFGSFTLKSGRSD